MNKTISALRNLSDELRIKLFGARGVNVNLNLDELILSGHSFGGGTMIEAASQLKDSEQPKALLLLDPWFYPIHDAVTNGKARLHCPV